MSSKFQTKVTFISLWQHHKYEYEEEQDNLPSESQCLSLSLPVAVKIGLAQTENHILANAKSDDSQIINGTIRLEYEYVSRSVSSSCRVCE